MLPLILELGKLTSPLADPKGVYVEGLPAGPAADTEKPRPGSAVLARTEAPAVAGGLWQAHRKTGTGVGTYFWAVLNSVKDGLKTTETLECLPGELLQPSEIDFFFF